MKNNHFSQKADSQLRSSEFSTVSISPQCLIYGNFIDNARTILRLETDTKQS